MCEPATLAALSLAVTVASTGAGLAAQVSESKAQAAANEEQALETRKATIANYDQLQLRQQQEIEAASQQVQTNQTEALKARSTASVAAGEAGITGLSVDGLLRDLYGQEARFNSGVNQNLDNVNDQIIINGDNVRRGAQSDINRLPTPATPDYIGAALRIGSAGIGYSDRLNA